MREKGLTVTDVLVVIVAMVLVVGIVTPGLNGARRRSARLVCQVNLLGIGRAMAVYAGDNDGDFPRAGGEDSIWSTRGKIRQWAVTPSGILQDDEDGAFGIRRNGTTITTPGEATVTSSLYLLIKYASVTPAQFVCKGDGAKVFKIPASGAGSTLQLEEAWDFGAYHGGTKPMDAPGMCNSYAYNMPYTWPAPDPSGTATLPTSFAVNNTFNPGNPVAADRNPHLDNRSEADIDPHRNSAAHQGLGQNVLYKDGRVEWRKDVTCGIGGDNIYTYGGDPNGIIPENNGYGGPFGIYDTYLVSEKNYY